MEFLSKTQQRTLEEINAMLDESEAPHPAAAHPADALPAPEDNGLCMAGIKDGLCAVHSCSANEAEIRRLRSRVAELESQIIRQWVAEC